MQGNVHCMAGSICNMADESHCHAAFPAKEKKEEIFKTFRSISWVSTRHGSICKSVYLKRSYSELLVIYL